MVAYVITMAAAPPMTTRRTARLRSAPPSRALSDPVTARAIRTATKVTGIRTDDGGRMIASSGSSAPSVNEIADEIADLPDRSLILRQVANGVAMRMAVLEMLVAS